MKRAAIVLTVALGAAAGCSNGVAWNDPFHKATTEEVAQNSARRGYTEIRRDKKIYVASTYDGVKRIQSGKEPALKVAAIGFGPSGEKVIFEASKDGALEKGLMKEFERRHGQQVASR